MIEQVVHSVKKDRLTGEIIESIPEDDPFQIPYPRKVPRTMRCLRNGRQRRTIY